MRLRDFLTDDESAHLIAVADKLFQRSPVLCENPEGCVDNRRTSSTAFLPDDDVTKRIQARAQVFAGLPLVEPLQVVRYTVGQEFQPHLDAHPEDVPSGQRAVCQVGGQRSATIFAYLNTLNPGQGGETVFPNLGLAVRPEKNSAVYWRGLLSDGAIDQRVLHGGAPVTSGIKYALNIWLLEPKPCMLTTGLGAPPNGTERLTFSNGAELDVEVVRPGPAMTRGLMHRKSMPEDHGMLFDFERRSDHTLYMRNTYIPLDMIFIDEDGTVVGIVENVPPLNEVIRGVHRLSRYALETNAGWAHRHGVTIGQKMLTPQVAQSGLIGLGVISWEEPPPGQTFSLRSGTGAKVAVGAALVGAAALAGFFYTRQKHMLSNPVALVEIVTFDEKGNAIDNAEWSRGDDIDDFIRMNVDEDSIQELHLLEEDGSVIESIRVTDEYQATAWMKRRAKRNR